MKYFKEILIALLLVVIVIGAVFWQLQYRDFQNQILTAQPLLPNPDSFVSRPLTPNDISTSSPQGISDQDLPSQVLKAYANAPYQIKYSSAPGDWGFHNYSATVPTDKYKIIFLSYGNGYKSASCSGLATSCFILIDSMDPEGFPLETNKPKILGELNWGEEPIYSSIKYVAPNSIVFQTTDWWPGGEGEESGKTENITNWEIDLVTFKMNKLNSYNQPVKN